MKINADLSQRAVVNSNELEWVDSPLAGVKRRMLERDGEEVARATSLVKYDPDSYFDAHTHTGGEEFLVLDGVFSDEMGDFPKGMYVRNPIGSKHKPHTKEGTTIFVKLRQFEPDDKEYVRIDTNQTQWLADNVNGVSIMPLHEFGTEQVALIKCQPETQLPDYANEAGEEVFVLSGSLSEESATYSAGAWIRNPAGCRCKFYSKEGCLLYVKERPPGVKHF